MQAEKIESLKDRFNQDQGRQEKKKEQYFFRTNKVSTRVSTDEPDAGRGIIDVRGLEAPDIRRD